MKAFAFMLLASAMLLLCSCGAGTPAVSTGVGQSLAPPPSIFVSGNWQFTATSGAQGATLLVGGSLFQNGDSVTGALRVDSPRANCLDQFSALSVTGGLGTASASPGISLNAQTTDGSVTISLSGTVTGNTRLDGTYTIRGACSDQGTVVAVRLPSFNGLWGAAFTSSARDTSSAFLQIIQGVANPDGTSSFSGSVSFTGPCFKSGTINTAAFPSGSFVIGSLVTLRIDTDNGTIQFQGMADQPNGTITGTYTVQGGTCPQTGTAVFTNQSPWDY